MSSSDKTIWHFNYKILTDSRIFKICLLRAFQTAFPCSKDKNAVHKPFVMSADVLYSLIFSLLSSNVPIFRLVSEFKSIISPFGKFSLRHLLFEIGATERYINTSMIRLARVITIATISIITPRCTIREINHTVISSPRESPLSADFFKASAVSR